MVEEITASRTEIAALCEAVGVRRLYLFGSAARESSLSRVHDLDFLVEFEPLHPATYARNYFRLAEGLEDLFRAPVDLVEIQAIDNPYFREAVEERRVLLYAVQGA